MKISARELFLLKSILLLVHSLPLDILPDRLFHELRASQSYSYVVHKHRATDFETTKFERVRRVMHSNGVCLSVCLSDVHLYLSEYLSPF